MAEPGVVHEENRPPGVAIVAGLYALAAVVALVLGATGVWRALAAPVGEPEIGDAAIRGFGVLASLAVIVYAGVAGTIAYGLWSCNRAAWGLAIFLAALGVLFGTVAILFGQWTTGVTVVLVQGVVAWYLLTPRVRAWFEIGDLQAARAERAA